MTFMEQLRQYLSPQQQPGMMPMPQVGMAASEITPSGVMPPGVSIDPTGMAQGVVQPAPGGGLFGGALNSYDAKTGITTQGWAGPALGAAQGLASAWLGMKQYGLAKDTLNENRRQFDMNWDAQRSTTNAQLADRQRARIAAAGGKSGGYMGVDDYMSTYGIK